MSVPVSVAHSRVANATRKAGGDRLAEPVKAAKRDLAEAVIEQFVQKTLAAAPPLLPEQKARLAAILQGPAR